MVGLASTGTIRKEHDGWWLEFKEELCAGDMRRLRKGFIRVDGAGNMSIRAEDPEQYGWDLIKLAVTAWSFPVEITDDGIGRLSDRIVTQITQDLNEQYKPISEQQKKA